MGQKWYLNNGGKYFKTEYSKTDSRNYKPKKITYGKYMFKHTLVKLIMGQEHTDRLQNCRGNKRRLPQKE